MPFLRQKEFLTERRLLFSSIAGNRPSSILIMSPWERGRDVQFEWLPVCRKQTLNGNEIQVSWILHAFLLFTLCIIDIVQIQKILSLIIFSPVLSYTNSHPPASSALYSKTFEASCFIFFNCFSCCIMELHTLPSFAYMS